ncbi:MAG: hypothetical protein OCD02_09725 [Spirochaetaceae bacterium]
MLKKIIVIILYIITVNIYSTEYVISEINIDGLKRTQNKTVLNIIEFYPGDIISDDQLDLLEQRIRKSRLFTNEFSVTLDPINDLETILNISLNDKWTLIPLPLIVVSSDSMLLGAFFIESNLLGLNQSLVSGVMYSDEGFSLFAAYSFPPLSFGNLSYYISYSDGDYTKDDFWGDEIETGTIQDISTGLTFKKELSQIIESSISLRYLFEDEFNYIGLAPSLTLSNLELLDSFQKGYNISLKLNSRLTFDDYTLENKISANFDNSLILFNNLFYASIHSGYSFDPIDYPLEVGGTIGSRVFKSQIESSFYVNNIIKYEIKIVDFNWGYITLPIYYESGIIEYNDSLEFYHGPGISILSYLNKVALPAIGINFVYDFENSRYNWGASIGLSM